MLFSGQLSTSATADSRKRPVSRRVVNNSANRKCFVNKWAFEPEITEKKVFNFLPFAQ